MFHLFVVVVAHFTGCLLPEPVFPFFLLSVAQVRSSALSTPLLSVVSGTGPEFCTIYAPSFCCQWHRSGVLHYLRPFFLLSVAQVRSSALSTPFFLLSEAQVRSSALSTPLLAIFLLLLTPDCVKSPRSKLREKRSDQDVVLFKPQLWKIIFCKLPDTQHLAISLLYSGLVKTEISSKTKQWLFPY